MKREKIDILKVAEENNNFVGTVLNEEKSDKLHLLQINAQKFARNLSSPFGCDVLFEKEDNTHRNGMVVIDLPAPVLLSLGKERDTLSELISGCDDFCIAPKQDRSSVRLTFAVRDIWKK